MEKVFAQSLTLPDEKTIITGDVTWAKDIATIINRAIPYILSFAGIALLLMLLGAGFTLLTSAGDPKKMESGKNRLTYALLGLFIILVAYWLVQIIGKIFGLAEVGTIFYK